jgi:hypothetical protein
MVVFGESVPKIEIRDGIVFVGPVATGDVIAYALPLFRQTYRRMGAVLALHDAAHSVVPLRGER